MRGYLYLISLLKRKILHHEDKGPFVKEENRVFISLQRYFFVDFVVFDLGSILWLPPWESYYLLAEWMAASF